MNIEIKMAATEADREAIYRLRYEIYVEEMHIFGAVADHERKMLIDPNDADARLMYALVDGEFAGTLRLNLGKDAPFSQEFEETYNFERFRPAATDAQMMAITRFMVKEKFRGSPVSYYMIEECARIGIREGIEVAFCDCQPHLIRYYQRIGFQGYECEVYNDPEFGIMVPHAFVFGDAGYLKSIRSPVYPIIEAGPEYPDKGRKINELMGRTNVRGIEAAETSENNVYDVPFFEGFETSDAKKITSRGYVFDVKPGDRVIRQGQTARTVFVVLSGSLEVCNDQGFCTAAHPGDVVGESAFLLNSRRIADVYAGDEGARMLSLDESRLQRLVNKPTPLAAMLLLNLSKALARKMAAMRTLTTKAALSLAA